MKSKWLIGLGIFLGVGLLMVGGAVLALYGQSHLMQHYDLYNCIYNNAEDNGFNQHLLMIQKVQDECVCFRKYDYNGSKVLEGNLC